MPYTLGNIRFTGQYGPKALTSQHAARYANTALVGGGTVLQKTGDEPVTLDFEAYLHFSFINVAAAVLAFETAKASGAALPLSDDEGGQYGDYVITSYSVTRSQANPTGETVAATVAVTLLQYVDPDPAGTALRASASNALALSANNPIPAVVAALPLTDQGQVVSTTLSANSGVTAAAVLVDQAAIPGADSVSILSRASALYSDARRAIEATAAKLTEAQTLAGRVPGMLEAAQAAALVFSSAAEAAAAGAITNAKAQSVNAVASIAGVAAIGRPLFVNQILRR